jgi:hypothetical protein
MTSKLFFIGLATFSLLACSASGPAEETLGAETPQPTPGGDCGFAGPRSCFCPDGTQSGTQTCSGTLSSCVCPAISSGPTFTQPSRDPTRVCADLRGQVACNATSYVSEEVPSSILFVLDRSGSMVCNAPPVQTSDACNTHTMRADPNQPSKWEITTQALNGAFAGLSGSTGAIGLSLFSSDGFCGVDSVPIAELAPASAVQLQALSDAMAASSPAGGTPIVGGVIQAYHHLHEELHAPGNRYVVLITDGEESCGTKGDGTDPADLEAARARLLGVEVQKAREANIKTFVVGVPGSEGARGFLSQLAFLGGTARDPNCVHDGSPAGNCHFDLTTQADFAGVLGDTLGKIGGKALGCEFKTPPGGNGLVNVQYSRAGGEPICFAQDAAPCEGGANGWQFAKDAAGNDDPTRVVLCGPACEAVKEDPTTKVDVVLGCPMIH